MPACGKGGKVLPVTDIDGFDVRICGRQGLAICRDDIGFDVARERRHRIPDKHRGGSGVLSKVIAQRVIDSLERLARKLVQPPYVGRDDQRRGKRARFCLRLGILMFAIYGESQDDEEKAKGDCDKGAYCPDRRPRGPQPDPVACFQASPFAELVSVNILQYVLI